MRYRAILSALLLVILLALPVLGFDTTTVTVTVLDGSGNPMPNTDFFIMFPGSTGTETRTTDSSGQFVGEWIPGDYSLMLTCDPNAGTIYSLVSKQLTVGDSDFSVDISCASSSYAKSVFLTVNGGEPLDATLFAILNEYDNFPNLYSLIVWPSISIADYPVILAAGTHTATSSQNTVEGTVFHEVEFSVSSDGQAVNIDLPPFPALAASATLTLYDDSGALFSSGYVTFYKEGQYFITKVSDANGVATADLPAGSYSASLRCSSGMYAIVPFEIADGQSFTGEVHCDSAIPFELIVTRGGAPLAGQKVLAYAILNPEGLITFPSKTTDDNGIVSYSLPAGNYHLKTNYLSHDHYVNVSVPSQSSAIIDIPQPMSELSVRVTDKDGSPLQDVPVDFMNATKLTSFVYAILDSGTTDADGVVSKEVYGGEYKLRVSCPLPTAKVINHSILVADGEEKSVDVQCGGAEINVRVIDAAGDPVSYATIMIKNWETANLVGSSGSLDWISAGSVPATVQLAPGSYSIRAAASPGIDCLDIKEYGPFDLDLGDTKDIEFVFDPDTCSLPPDAQVITESSAPREVVADDFSLSPVMIILALVFLIHMAVLSRQRNSARGQNKPKQ